MRLRFWVVVCVLSNILMAGRLAAQIGVLPAGVDFQSKLPMDTPVITMDGFCDPSPKKAGDDCKTVVTRAQFEKLSEATQPSMLGMAKKPGPANFLLAHKYPDTLILAKKGKEMGLESDPLYQEKLRFAQLQVMADIMTSHLVEQAEAVSDEEVHKYYKEHLEEFEEIGVMRIYVPKEKQHPPDPDINSAEKIDRAADEAEMKQVAEKIAKEAQAGGDFDKLEEEAYAAAGNPDAPNTDLSKIMRPNVPTEFEKTIFGLEIGKVSDPVEGARGWYILKVYSRDTLTEDHARGIIISQRLKHEMEAVHASVKTKLNPEYFKEIKR